MIWYFLALLLVMLVAALLHSWATPSTAPAGRHLEVWLMHLFLWGVGIRCISLGIILLYEPAALLVDDLVVWVVENPFQVQTAFAALTLGVLGIVAQWIRGAFWVATVIAACIYAVGQLIVTFSGIATGEMIAYQVIANLALPIVLIFLICIYRGRAGSKRFWSIRGTHAEPIA